MTAEELDRIKRAEEIQRYTENRCEALEKENAELKKACNETQELLDKQIEATYKVVEELNKAKDIIKKFWEFVNNESEYDPEHPQKHTDLWNKLCEETEKFIKEVK